MLDEEYQEVTEESCEPSDHEIERWRLYYGGYWEVTQMEQSEPSDRSWEDPTVIKR